MSAYRKEPDTTLHLNTHARGVTHCLCLHVDVLKLHLIRTREVKLRL